MKHIKLFFSIFILFSSCEKKDIDFKNKILKETGVNVYNSKFIDDESNTAIGDFSEEFTIKIDSLNSKNIQDEVFILFSEDNDKKWSKLVYGFRLEKTDKENKCFYQYDFDFVKQKIYYLYIDE